MQKKGFIFILFLIIIFNFLKANDSIEFKKLTFNGYFSFVSTTFSYEKLDNNPLLENLVHNRINLGYDFFNYLKLNLSFRNRLIYGETVKYSFYSDGLRNLAKDYGVIKLTKNILENNSLILNSSIDRINFIYSKNNFEFTFGRQRINWAQTFVWNPNDIFNVYSFFDIDYPERPGCDAVLLRYYTTSLSSIEIATKLNDSKKITSAMLYKFNKKGFDIQVLGGIYESNDLIIGSGWSGNFKEISFRGEMSYFRSIKNLLKDTASTFLVSLGSEYFFSNKTLIQLEFLYNNNVPKDFNTGNLFSYFTENLSIKNLSFVKYNLFAQVNYQLTPILNFSLAVMYFPEKKGFFLGPSVSRSFSNDFDFSFYFQNFQGNFLTNEHVDKIRIGYIRFRYSF